MSSLRITLRHKIAALGIVGLPLVERHDVGLPARLGIPGVHRPFLAAVIADDGGRVKIAAVDEHPAGNVRAHLVMAQQSVAIEVA